MNKMYDCLMIGSYICGLNRELFLHNDRNHSFLLLEAEILKLCLCQYIMYVS